MWIRLFTADKRKRPHTTRPSRVLCPASCCCYPCIASMYVVLTYPYCILQWLLTIRESYILQLCTHPEQVLRRPWSPCALANRYPGDPLHPAASYLSFFMKPLAFLCVSCHPCWLAALPTALILRVPAVIVTSIRCVHP